MCVFVKCAKPSWVQGRRKEGNVLFNDALNTFYLRLYGVGHMVKDHSDSERGNPCRYSFRFAARVLLYASSHRQDNTYHGLCYTSCGALSGTRNSSMGPPWRIDPTTHRTMSERSYHGATSRSRDFYITFFDHSWIFQLVTNVFQVWAISSYYSWPIRNPGAALADPPHYDATRPWDNCYCWRGLLHFSAIRRRFEKCNRWANCVESL